MSSFSNPLMHYQDISLNVDQKGAPDFTLTSPNSDSTTLYANSLSPNLQEVWNPAYEIPLEPWIYEDNYTFKGIESDRKDFMSVKVEADEKISSKSKRIMKRNVAKERTKQRKDTESFLAGVDKKFLPEGFDDPDLDERTKKKMIQMVRNRISAQNSRDRKKVLMQQLEEMNAQLVEENSNLKKEKTALMNEIKKLQQSEAQLLKEREALICPSCRQPNNQHLPENEPYHHQEILGEEDHNVNGGFSNLSSPVLSRFSSAGRGIFTFFTFAALISLIVVMNAQEKGEIGLQGLQFPQESKGVLEFKDNRILEIKNEPIQSPIDFRVRDKPTKVEIPFKNSLVIQNIGPLKNNFNLNYDMTFKSHIKQKSILDAFIEANNKNFEQEKQAQPEPSNAIVDYNYFKTKNLRRNAPTIVAKDLPVISQTGPREVLTSTLFCPNALEFTEAENENIGMEQKDRTLNIEKADYLQLFVPRKTIARFDIKSNMSDLYDLPIQTDEDDNAMLEIWCKVFLIRDLGSSF